MIEILDKLAQNVKDYRSAIGNFMQGGCGGQPTFDDTGLRADKGMDNQGCTDDIKRFASSKKYALFCGLGPRVQNSNTTAHYGKITRCGPKELRTAFIQLTMGIRRSHKTAGGRIMKRYERLKIVRGGGKSIIAASRKLVQIVRTMLSREEDFNERKIAEHFLSKTERLVNDSQYVS